MFSETVTLGEVGRQRARESWQTNDTPSMLLGNFEVMAAISSAQSFWYMWYMLWTKWMFLPQIHILKPNAQYKAIRRWGSLGGV